VYSHTGQPSLAPVVFRKFMLAGRVETSLVTVAWSSTVPCSLTFSIFLGYKVDEELPWHSTISRTRQLYPVAVFEHLFDQCVVAGLVAGDTQAVDLAPVKANT
jgi:hypothetical protein